ncbi:hypothetical protein, partial [Anaerorhabdus sp.]|uniref:hypothetical protein n=1 Tax=Anaerorhabdus sp. TaxID=1872524 RepID=UPI002FC79ABF
LLAIGITLFMYSSSKLKSISINKKLRIVLSIVLIIYSLNYIGLFEPIKTRVAIQTENIDSDRGELQKKTLSNLNENNVKTE